MLFVLEDNSPGSDGGGGGSEVLGWDTLKSVKDGMSSTHILLLKDLASLHVGEGEGGGGHWVNVWHRE